MEDQVGILVEKARQGSEEARHELVVLHQKRAFRVALRFLRNEEEAMDVVQDAFVRVFSKLHSFQGNSQFFTWLFRIIRNLCIDLLRRKKRWREEEYQDHLRSRASYSALETGSARSQHRDSPLHNTLRKELNKKLADAFDQLSPDHRSILVLREIEGHSYEKIADILECPKGTVMSRLHHARKKIQNLLGPYLEEREEDE